MPQKLSDEKIIAKHEKQEYLLRIQELKDVISEKNVFKQDATFTFGEVVFPATKWFFGEYTINSDSRMVSVLDDQDREVCWFYLQPKDYKKLEAACKKRRAELLKQQRNR